MAIAKRIDDLVAEDIRSLLAAKVPEDRNLEYKTGLPTDSERSKRTLLKTVSSFANTAGGYVLYGIAASNGVPTDIEGITAENWDQAKLGIEHLIRDGIEPRVSGAQVRQVDVDGHQVLCIYVPQSWTRPHMVKYDKTNKFFGRGSGGAFEMDYWQIRQAFLLGQDTSKQIESFRTERSRICLKEAGGAPCFLWHSIPLASLSGGTAVNITRARDPDLVAHWLTLEGVFSGQRFNADGFKTWTEDSWSHARVQVFRTGIVESFASFHRLLTESSSAFPYKFVEDGLAKQAARYISGQQLLGADHPFILVATMLNVKDLHIPGPYMTTGIIEDSVVEITPSLVEGPWSDINESLRDVMDVIWQSAGFVGQPRAH